MHFNHFLKRQKLLSLLRPKHSSTFILTEFTTSFYKIRRDRIMRNWLRREYFTITVTIHKPPIKQLLLVQIAVREENSDASVYIITLQM